MQAFNSDDKIGIYYFRPGDNSAASTGALHAGVFYSTVMEGGKRVTVTSTQDRPIQTCQASMGQGELAKELSGIRDPATPYGKITMKSDTIFGVEGMGQMPLPDGIVGAKVLASGDLGQGFKAITDTFNEVSNGLYYYFPWLQNSNTVAVTALFRAGIIWDTSFQVTPIEPAPSGIENSNLPLCNPWSSQPGPANGELFFRDRSFSFRQRSIHRPFLMEFRLNTTAIFTPIPVMPLDGRLLRLSQPRQQ